MKVWGTFSLKEAWIGLRASTRGPVWTLEVCPLPFLRISLQWKSPAFITAARRAFRGEEGCLFLICGDHGVVGMEHGFWEPKLESEKRCPECTAPAEWRAKEHHMSAPGEPIRGGRRALILLDELGGGA